MAHPLKQRLNHLTDDELGDLESILTLVLHEQSQHAEWLLTEQAHRQMDDEALGDAHAANTAWIAILEKVLGEDPPRGN